MLKDAVAIDMQVPDSAGTSTAMHTGIKTDSGVIGVGPGVVRGDHATVAGNELTSILGLAEMAGMSTGVISTARITHATPAAAYAVSAERDWEGDKDIPEEQLALGAVDIARQLIEYPYGDGLEVALGGGRRSFLPGSMADPEDAGHTGERLDERDLTREWVDRYANAAFVWNAEQFAAIDPARTDHLLGLFERSHMEYEHDRPTDAGGEPSLAEMTGKAIRILSRNPNGFYLLVEAGRVDHAHHDVNAYRTLTDGLAFADAVATAAGMTSEQDFSLRAPDEEFDLDPYLEAIRRELASFGFSFRVERRSKRVSTAIESAFIKGGTRVNLAHVGMPDYLQERLPRLQQVRIRLDVDTDPPPLARYDVLTLLTPIPFQVRLFDLPCLFAGKLHALLCRDWMMRVKGRDFYDFVWYLGRRIRCDVRHLQARMEQTGHWQAGEDLDVVHLRRLLTRRFEQVDFDQARSDVRPFIRDDAELALWDRTFFQSLAGRVDG